MLLQTYSISKNFGGLKALLNIDMIMNEGETIGMIGPNGSGKTTFVNVVSGTLRADGGRVVFEDHDVTRSKAHKLSRLGMARTYQATLLFADLTVRENMIAANLAHYRSLNRAAANEGIESILQRLQLMHKMEDKASSLTLYGQKRLEIGMRLIAQPKLLMLDEPVGGLSPTEILNMLELLKELRSEYTLFIIEHTMKVIFDIADRVVVLNSGMKLAEGPPEAIVKDSKVIEAYLGKEDYFDKTTS